jgi:hypothetical protein
MSQRCQKLSLRQCLFDHLIGKSDQLSGIYASTADHTMRDHHGFRTFKKANRKLRVAPPPLSRRFSAATGHLADVSVWGVISNWMAIKNLWSNVIHLTMP